MRTEWNITELEEKLLKARCRLMTREPWYGHIAMMMEWICSDMPGTSCEEAKTMGVRIVGGIVQCIWYPGFVERQTIKELYGVIQHEIEHIVRCHTIRIGTGREHDRWNVVADMVVNGKKSKPICAYHDPSTSENILPVSGNGVYLPEDWESGQTTETLYEKIGGNIIQQKCPQCGGLMKNGKSCNTPQSSPTKGKPAKGKAGKAGKTAGQSGQGQGGQGQGNQGQGGQGQGGQSGQGQHSCGNCGGDCDEHGNATSGAGRYEYNGFGGQLIDSHEIWQDTEDSEDEVRQIVKDMTDQATEKCQGTAPGHLTSILKELGKPVVRWRELLRNYMGCHVGNQRRTFSRRNRRNDQFGLPGISHHAAGRVVVVVDTSGSISDNELMQFFTEIDTISSRATVNVLQWDFAFQGYDKYRRGGWKKFKIKGRGGTDMDAPVRWLSENRLVPDCTVLLTDGYCNWSAPQSWYPEHGMITVITSGKDVVKPPGWGHIVWMRGDHK